MRDEEMTLNTVSDLKFAEHTFTVDDMKDMFVNDGWVAMA